MLMWPGSLPLSCVLSFKPLPPLALIYVLGLGSVRIAPLSWCQAALFNSGSLQQYCILAHEYSKLLCICETYLCFSNCTVAFHKKLSSWTWVFIIARLHTCFNSHWKDFGNTLMRSVASVPLLTDRQIKNKKLIWRTRS